MMKKRIDFCVAIFFLIAVAATIVSGIAGLKILSTSSLILTLLAGTFVANA